MKKSPQMTAVQRSILDDVSREFGSAPAWVLGLLRPLIWATAHRFARVAARFDETVARAGFREAAREALPVLLDEVQARGVAHVPPEGPLLIVSNHPGTWDSLAIAASLPRDDLQIIAGGFSMLRNLPHISQHMIFMNPGAGANVSVVRTAVRHLRAGGAVLIFPHGRVEPDPSILPGALDTLDAWSPSMELFVKRAPQTQTMVTVVSGVMARWFLRSPLLRLMKGVRNPITLAETSQVMAKLFFPRWVRLDPVVSFGLPRAAGDLRENGETLYQAIIADARRHMAEELARYGVPT